jgi:hypothetical protein
MINTVRVWTRLPMRRFFVAIEKQERRGQRHANEAPPKVGFIESFFKMWEAQMELVVRNLSD